MLELFWRKRHLLNDALVLKRPFSSNSGNVLSWVANTNPITGRASCVSNHSYCLTMTYSRVFFQVQQHQREYLHVTWTSQCNRSLLRGWESSRCASQTTDLSVMLAMVPSHSIWTLLFLKVSSYWKWNKISLEVPLSVFSSIDFIQLMHSSWYLCHLNPSFSPAGGSIFGGIWLSN